MYRIIMLCVSLALIPSCSVGEKMSLGEKMLSDTASRNGALVCASQRHQLLSNLANSQAYHMSKLRDVNHLDFGLRAGQIYRELGLVASEICAQTYPSTLVKDVADDAWDSFQASPKHWAVASKKHTYWGGSMHQGSDGRWYVCIIVADEVGE